MRQHWTSAATIFFISALSVQAQTTITSITATSGVNTGQGSTRNITGAGGSPNYSQTYDGLETRLNSVTAGGNQWNTGLSGTVYVRRNADFGNTANQNINNNIGWNASITNDTTSTTRTVAGVYSNDTAATLMRNNLRAGVENTFLNVEASGTSSTIERVDYVYSGSLTASANLAFAVLERGQGGSGANGAFKIAAITSIDANGRPTGYASTVISVAANSYGNGNLATATTYDVMSSQSRTGTDLNTITSIGLGPQGMSGTLITADSLITSGTTIYGYSIFAADVTVTGNDLVDWTNTTNFSLSSTTSDMDFVSIGATTFVPVPEPATLLGLSTLTILGVASLRRRFF